MRIATANAYDAGIAPEPHLEFMNLGVVRDIVVLARVAPVVGIKPPSRSTERRRRDGVYERAGFGHGGRALETRDAGHKRFE